MFSCPDVLILPVIPRCNLCSLSPSLQWKTEILDFCPSTRILLIGCKTDLRTDVCTLMELSNQKQTPISHEQARLAFRNAQEAIVNNSETPLHLNGILESCGMVNRLTPSGVG